VKKILIVGAHTAVAKSLVECLLERDLDAELIRATTTDNIEAELTLLDEQTIKSADLAVLAFGGKFARGIGEGLLKLKKPVIDLSGTFSPTDGARTVFGGLDPLAHLQVEPGSVVSIPIGPAAPVVAALEALTAFLPRRATVVTQESAVSFDQPGLDELSAQVRAVFNMKDAETEIFRATLAFNSWPLAPESEEAMIAQLRAGLVPRAPALVALPLFVTRTLVPTFSADSLVLEVEVEGTPDAETVAGALAAARTLHKGDPELVALDAVGRDDALVTHLRVGPGRIGAWMAYDRMRLGSATQAARLIEAWLAPR
jgi:aspartate-semialdehyde dehydrogenase